MFQLFSISTIIVYIGVYDQKCPPPMSYPIAPLLLGLGLLAVVTLPRAARAQGGECSNVTLTFCDNVDW